MANNSHPLKLQSLQMVARAILVHAENSRLSAETLKQLRAVATESKSPIKEFHGRQKSRRGARKIKAGMFAQIIGPRS